MIVFSILLFRPEILGIQHQIGIINKRKNQYRLREKSQNRELRKQPVMQIISTK